MKSFVINSSVLGTAASWSLAEIIGVGLDNKLAAAELSVARAKESLAEVVAARERLARLIADGEIVEITRGGDDAGRGVNRRGRARKRRGP
jgi:hypothetical protein